MTVLGRPYPHFVYRLFDGDGQLLYIGMTADMPTRLRAHLTGSPKGVSAIIRRHYHHHTVVEYPSGSAAHEAEKAAIAAECPPLNINHNPKVWRRLGGRVVPVGDCPQVFLDDTGRPTSLGSAA